MTVGLRRFTSLLLALCLFISQSVLSQSHTMAYLAQSDVASTQASDQSPAVKLSQQLSANDCQMMTVPADDSMDCSEMNNCCDSDCAKNDACQSNCSHCFAFSVSGAMTSPLTWPMASPTNVVNATPLKHFYIISGFTELRPPIS